MHLKRLLTALCALPVLTGLLVPELRWLFHLVLLAAALIGLTEFFRMPENRTERRLEWAGYALTAVLFTAVYLRHIVLLPVILALWASIPLVCQLFAGSPPRPELVLSAGRSLLGAVWVCLPIALVLQIELFYPRGNYWILFLLLTVFVTDTGAFYCGRLFGRHKLYPAISPGKTWEGAVGGLVSSLLAGAWFLKILALEPLGVAALGLIAALSVAGQIGDLAESMVKRAYGVKDSGRLLPGHGGLLDRVDGVLFAAPVLAGYLWLRMP